MTVQLLGLVEAITNTVSGTNVTNQLSAIARRSIGPATASAKPTSATHNITLASRIATMDFATLAPTSSCITS